MSVLEDRTAKAQESLDAGVPFPTSLSIGATRIWSVGEILTAANKNTYERTVLEDLAGRNGPVEYEGAIVIDSLTTTERDAITLTGTGGLGASGNGLVIYNSTKAVFERYENGAWVSYNDLAAMTLASAAQGDVFFRGASAIQRLSAGTAGRVLETRGTSANPRWTDPPQVPTGLILDFGGTTAPTGFLSCDGAAVSRTTYGDLFAVIGGTWGVGNSSTTFNVPDLRRRTTIGSGGTRIAGPQTTVGSTGGAETHTLTEAEMPAHRHGLFDLYTGSGSGRSAKFQSSTAGLTATTGTGATGGGSSFNNMQPSATVLKIIKT